MLSEYFILALKNLRKRGLRSWLTMLGIFIGIAAVVSLISLSQGLETAIVGQFSSLDPDKLVVQSMSTGFGPPGSTAVRKLTDHDLELIESVNGVEEAIPRLIRTVSVEYNDIRLFRDASDIPEDEDQAEIVYDSINAEPVEGRLLETDDRGKVVLGSGYYQTEDFDKQISLGNKIQVNEKEFEVVGFLKPGSTFIISDVVLMTHQDFIDTLEIEDEIDLIVVQVEDQDNIEQVATDIERRLRQDRNQKIGEEDFSVQTPLQSLAAISTILDIINIIVIGIAAISILIGAIGIANTMFTSVLERRKEIGIMKSIGAKNSDILKIFMIESSLLGLVGGIVGVILGLALAFAASGAAGSFLGGINLQVAISLPLITAAITFSFLLGLLFGTVPAWQASKLNPVDALRK